jgi:hypothetical protein
MKAFRANAGSEGVKDGGPAISGKKFWLASASNSLQTKFRTCGKI